MNVASILQDCYTDLGYKTVPAHDVVTRLRSYIQKSYTQLLREPSLVRLRDTIQPLTFSSVANQTVYGLPSSIVRVTAVTDRSTNRLLDPMDLRELRKNDPGLTSTGTAWAWVPLGYGATAFVPASTGLWVASTSALDTTQTAQMNGIRSAGLPTGDVSRALSGTTRVQFGSVIDIVDVQSLSLNATAVGVVSFYDAGSSGNVVAQIPIGSLFPKYYRIQLYPTPDAAITYYVDGQYGIPELDDRQDIPLLPEDFHDMLATGALMSEYQRKDDTNRLVMMSQEWQNGLERLKHMIGTSPSETPVMGRRIHRRFSRFGAWTPNDGGW